MTQSMSETLAVEDHRVTTWDGWSLSLHRSPDARAGAAPVLFVPGYGMNGWIFRYHPNARSFMGHLVDAGLDPWWVDLRGTSTSRRRRGAPAPSLRDQALIDLPSAFDYIAAATGADRVSAIGCSLGGSLLYAWAGLDPQHRIERLVTMGSPLRWGHTAITRTFAWGLPAAGSVPMRGTRRLARVALPVAGTIAPWALSLYLNPKITQIRPSRMLTRTVEDPAPTINRDLGRWMRTGDLHLDGVNVTDALSRYSRPLLLIFGSGDGICPEAASTSATERTSGPVDTLRVDHPDGHRVGHADLFISELAPSHVFPRVSRFLESADSSYVPDYSAA